MGTYIDFFKLNLFGSNKALYPNDKILSLFNENLLDLKSDIYK